jgi:hypothetical protein
MKYLAIAPVVLVVLAAAFLATPAFAGPNYDKWVASLLNESDVRVGQVIFNTNWEDEFGGYELEVEVEECEALANSTVNVSLDGVLIDTLFIELDGNGKDTFYVDAITNTSIVEVEGAVTLTSGDWRLWEKRSGPK